MQHNIDIIKAFTTKEEGGYTNAPADDGNWLAWNGTEFVGKHGVGTLIGSNKGCGAPATANYMRNHGLGTLTASLMRNIPDSIYSGLVDEGYWTPLAGNSLPDGIDLQAFDYGWNRGVGTSAKAVQAAVGAAQDGIIGPRTLSLIDDAYVTDSAGLINKIAAIHVAQYRTLYNFSRYGKGWLSRNEDCRVTALKLAGCDTTGLALTAPLRMVRRAQRLGITRIFA